MALLRTPVAGEVDVHYGQICVESDVGTPGVDFSGAFAGQRTGLCGAAGPGALLLLTGMHTGSVGFTVEVHDQAPPLDAGWEDVVEVSFRPAAEGCGLFEWGGASWELGLAVTDYRVRYSARGMDEGNRADTRHEGDPPLDSYLLQFWPAPPAPDALLRHTAEVSAYWHDWAVRLPPPPTPAERAEAERLDALAREEAERERELAHERWEWGGRLPSPALRRVGGNVSGLLEFDPELVHALDDAGPDVQRAVAVMAAHRACEAAGLAGIDWIAAGLTALAHGRPLPPPLDDEGRAWRVLEADPRVPDRDVGEAVPPPRPPFEGNAPTAADLFVGPAAAYAALHTAERSAPPRPLRYSQPHMALPALFRAAHPDPLQAAIDAVHAAVTAHGEHWPAFLEQAWAACRTCCRSRSISPAPDLAPAGLPAEALGVAGGHRVRRGTPGRGR
ncbi:hypothetical protein LG634_30540 [Streptomyces bambusae]|uniref:hypothetical protein n=1 Tax=Streptomyces bambusae TaxID=1550616 RepID=UPI001CFF9782|nr:hypothetical protein [Streptomyces bambusae]MCB5169133.1 hypothetical protein [Streptomyces bambusae]